MTDNPEPTSRARLGLPPAIALHDGCPSSSRGHPLEGSRTKARREVRFATSCASRRVSGLYDGLRDPSRSRRAASGRLRPVGIGGVHRGGIKLRRVADLKPSASPVVVCCWARVVLDRAHARRLERSACPARYGIDEFPSFYVRSIGSASGTLNARRRGAIATEHRSRRGPPLSCDRTRVRPSREEVEGQVRNAIAAAERDGIRGADLTPYLLRALGEATNYRALDANIALLRANAQVAAQLALTLSAP